MITRSLLVVSMLFLVLAVGGCWDHQPPEDTAFILMIGLDVDPERSEQTAITQLAVLPSGLAAGEEGGQPQGTPFYLLSNTARTLEGAQLSVVDHLSRLPRLDHLDALILGEDFARKGTPVEPAIAWALRHPQIRPGVYLFVAEGSAQHFLDARPALDPLPAAALTGLMRNAGRVAYVYPVRAYEFARTLMSPRGDGAIPMVRRINPLAARVPPDFEQQPFTGSSSGDDQGSGEGSDPMETQIKLVGMAIFKGGTMIGSIMQEDAKGLTWIRGKSQTALTIEHPKHVDSFIAALTVRSSAKRKTRLHNERALLTIDIEASVDVWGEGLLQAMGVSRHVKEIERDLANTIVTQVETTMERLQQMEADIFGFGEQLYRDSPQDWDKISDRWDELYRDANLNVTAKVTVRRTGLSR